MYFQSYRDLALLSRDGMTIALTKTNQLIFERWLKLLDTARQQVELKTLHVYIKALFLNDVWLVEKQQIPIS
jgi:hypothetical protein